MKTVAESPLRLFGLERSVYTRIARMALEEKRVPYALHEVEIFGPEGVPGEYLKRQPFGRIPVPTHDGFSLYETRAITRYVDEALSGPVLQPADPRARARMNQIVSILDAYAYRPMVWGVFVQRVSIPLEGGKTEKTELDKALRSAETCLMALRTLTGSLPYLADREMSLADIHAFPVFRYFCLAPEGYALVKEYPEVARWYEHMRSRPSVTSTMTSYEIQAG